MARVAGLVLASLILIAALPPSKSTVNQAGGTDDQGGYQSVATSPSPASTEEFSAYPTPHASDRYTYNNYYYLGPSDQWTVLVAISTVLIAAFTGFLWWTSRKQWDIANKTLLLQFRLRVIVRNVAALDPIVNASMITVFLTIVNTGGTRATIESSTVNMGLYDNPDLPVRLGRRVPPHETETEAIGINTIEPGVSHLVRKDYRLTEDLAESESERFMTNQDHLYVFGRIQYRNDSLGLPHETGFCRRYDLGKRTFVATDNPGYEYQD